MGKPMEFSVAQKRKAALDLTGTVIELSFDVHEAHEFAIQQRCQLNAAVELLREGRQGHLEREFPCEIDPGNLVLTPIDDRCTWCQDTDDFLSHFPEGAKK